MLAMVFALAYASPVSLTELPALVGHGPSKLIPRVRYDPSGTRLLSTSDDGLRVWNAADGSLLRFVPGRFSHALLDADGATLFAGRKDHALAFDVATGKEVGRWATGWDWVEGLATDPQERWVVIQDDSAEHMLRYDRKTGEKRSVPKALQSGSSLRGFSPAGVLYATNQQQRLVAWDPASDETWTDDRPGLVARIDWTEKTGWMALTVWDWPSSQPQPWLQGWIRITGPDGQRFELDQTGYDAAIGPDGALVAVCLDQRIDLIEVATGETVARLQLDSPVSWVDISADYQLAVATLAGPVRRWQIARVA